jgi:hypothetical protein
VGTAIVPKGVTRRLVLVSLATVAARTAFAEPLPVTETKAPDVNCVFNQACTIAVTDSLGAIPIAGISGRAILQSRTFVGAAGAPAAGLTGYEFRVDLTQATAKTAKGCVTQLMLDLGPLAKLAYPGGGGSADVFVITSGGIGTVRLTSADRHERAVTFTFASPICPGVAGAKGATSYFFGFAAAKRPEAVTARIGLDNGTTLDVATRAPAP